jgi:hypothetical protein
VLRETVSLPPSAERPVCPLFEIVLRETESADTARAPSCVLPKMLLREIDTGAVPATTAALELPVKAHRRIVVLPPLLL